MRVSQWAQDNGKSGVVDNLAEDEADALDQIRRWLSYLPQNVWELPPRRASEDDERRQRTVLMEEPERPQAEPRAPLPADLLPYLSPTQLRELADLEEAREQGRLTEGRYRRERERILKTARDESATSR